MAYIDSNSEPQHLCRTFILGFQPFKTYVFQCTEAINALAPTSEHLNTAQFQTALECTCMLVSFQI